MNALSLALTVVALLSTAVVYGTDMFCAIVQRPALAQVDDRTLVMSTGQIHRFGDRRMPIPGALGGAAAAIAAVTAGLAGQADGAIANAIAVICGGAWLVIYLRVSAPINRQLTRAARADVTLDNARTLQQRWDSVIYGRAALQGAATLALCIALIVL